MSDRNSVNIAENSPEYVAYRLLMDIAAVEGQSKGAGFRISDSDRQWILDTYAECLMTVKGNRRFDRTDM